MWKNGNWADVTESLVSKVPLVREYRGMRSGSDHIPFSLRWISAQVA